MYKCKNASLLAVFTLFISIIIVVSHKGDSSRNFANGSTSFTIYSPENAYAIWSDRKLHGRVLILFDNYPHAKGLRFYNGTPQLTQSNVMEFSIFKNIIRKIYYIVPEKQWADFRGQKEMNPIREVLALDQGVYLNTLSGIPLIAVTPSSLPEIKEIVLVYTNNKVFDTSFTEDLLKKKHITSDVFITCQDIPR